MQIKKNILTKARLTRNHLVVPAKLEEDSKEKSLSSVVLDKFVNEI
jgi:hypothetical protein